VTFDKVAHESEPCLGYGGQLDDPEPSHLDLPGDARRRRSHELATSVRCHEDLIVGNEEGPFSVLAGERQKPQGKIGFSGA
jgi:hypothetical protein